MKLNVRILRSWETSTAYCFDIEMAEAGGESYVDDFAWVKNTLPGGAEKNQFTQEEIANTAARHFLRLAGRIKRGDAYPAFFFAKKKGKDTLHLRMSSRALELVKDEYEITGDWSDKQIAPKAPLATVATLSAAYDAYVLYDGSTYSRDSTSTTLNLFNVSPNVERVAIRWDITSIPSGADVTNSQLIIKVTTLQAGSTVDIQAYNQDGQAIPSSDTAQNMYIRCANDASPYLAANTFGQSTGVKTLDLTAACDTDIETARTAGTSFSLGLDRNDTGAAELEIEALENAGTDEPKLEVTYTQTHALQATIDATSSMTAAAAIARSLAATIAGISSLVADLTTHNPLPALEAQIAASSSLIAELAGMARAAEATIPGTSDLTASMTVQRPLAATIPGTSGMTAAEITAKSLAATIAATSGLTAAMNEQYALSATIAGVSAMTAALTIVRTHQVQVDWDNDGDYGDTGEDVTDYVRGNPGLWIERGRDQIRAFSPPMVGVLDMELDNQSRDYSPENVSSPIYGNVLPRRKMNVTMAVENTSYALFTGWIDDVIQHPEQGKKSVSFPCIDGLGRLRGTKISTALYASIRTDQAIGYILDAASEALDIAGATVGGMSKWGTAVLGTATFGSYGWLISDRVFDTGKTVLDYWWLDDEDAFDALVKVLNSEGPGSMAYVDGDGKVHFESRHYRIKTARCTASQASISDVSSSEPAWSQFNYDGRLKDVINICSASVQTRTADDDPSVIWSTDEYITLGANESTTIHASAGGPFINLITPVPGTDIVLRSGSATVDVNRSSGASVDITITAGSSGASISTLQLRAYALVVSQVKTVKNTINTTTSQTKYGQRPYTLPILPEINANIVQDLVNAIVLMYQEPRTIITVGLINANDTRLAQQLSRQLSDRITVLDTQTGLNADVWIERVAHEITENYKVQKTVFGCEKVYSFPSTDQWGSAVLGTAKFGV